MTELSVTKVGNSLCVFLPKRTFIEAYGIEKGDIIQIDFVKILARMPSEKSHSKVHSIKLHDTRN